jgi:cyanate permease
VTRRRPHPVVTLAGWLLTAAVFAAVSQSVGYVLAYLADLIWGVRP